MKRLEFAVISVLFVLLFHLCSWTPFCNHEQKIGKKIGIDIAKSIAKKYHLSMTGIGEGGHPKYTSISFGFLNISDPVTVEGARRIIVPIVEDFLNQINTHPEIANEFVNFPLTRKNIGLDITFLDKDQKSVYSPFVWGVSNIGEKIFYWSEVYHPPQPGVYGKDEREHKETFEEAKAILEKEKQTNEISSKPLTDANEILPLEKPSP